MRYQPLILAMFLMASCHANFALPTDIQSLTIQNSAGQELPIRKADATWALSLLAQCEWPRPRHVSPEPRYRLIGRQANGDHVVFQVRGRHVVVTTPAGAGRCVLKPADAQRLAGLIPG